jgi:hypothetical protein
MRSGLPPDFTVAVALVFAARAQAKLAPTSPPPTITTS